MPRFRSSPRKRESQSSWQRACDAATSRGHERPRRPVRLCAPEVLVDRKRRRHALSQVRAHAAALSRQADRPPRALGERRARPRVHGGARTRWRRWRTITYAQTLDKVRRIGAALLTRNLSAERPIVILSGNDLEHALLGLAANYVGIPYAPVSPAYSLISSDFGKLRHIVNLLTPGPRVRLRRRAVRARHRRPSCRPTWKSSSRAIVPNRSTLFSELDAAPDAADAAHAQRHAATRSRNSCSPPARPACRRA